MKILIIQTTNDMFSPTMDVTKIHEEQIKQLVPHASIKIVKDTDTKALEKEISDAEIVIAHMLSQITLANANKLKWIQVTSAGVNNMPQELKKSSIIITNASGVHPIPIAEHVMAFMLMFSHQLHTLHRTQIEQKTWDYSYSKYPIQELKGKTVIIFGLGRIGTQIAKLAKGFDMKVLAMVRDTSKKNQYVDEVFTEKNVATMLSRADFVVNAMPLTNETHHFFNKEKFKQMKPSSYFINIGRGPVVHETDLIKALQAKTIAGAGLDVFETEPLPKDSLLWNMENVLITPHSSGQTPEYMNRVINIFCGNLKAYLNNKPMPNLVDKEKGY